METVDRINNVRRAWAIAWDKSYFKEAMIAYTEPDFFTFVGGLIPGLLAALFAPIIGEAAGGMIGTALGSLITAVTGQAEVIPVLASWGATAGLLAADAALAYMGIMFIKDFIVPRIGAVGQHFGKGCLLAYNSPPQSSDTQLDPAAKELAEGGGYFLGLVLMGLVLYLMKGPMDRIAKMNASLLEKTCPGLTDWVARNGSKLMDRFKNGPTRNTGEPPKVPPPTAVPEGTVGTFEPRVIEGGLEPGTRTTLDAAKESVGQILPSLLGRGGQKVLPRGIGALDGILTKFKLVRAEKWGPDAGKTGWQLFWQKDNVLVRFKTTGENAGPRANKPHLSIGYNDARGFDWQNDMAKFTYDGKVAAKVITDPAKFKPEADFQGNPQRFVLLPTNFDMSAVDAWAARTHFNADPPFDLTGLDGIVARAPK